jgi:hypothetical protein
VIWAGTYYVATLSRYVLVEAASEDDARCLGRVVLAALFADYRGNLNIEIRTIRPATGEEIEFWQWHNESVAAERAKATFRIDIADDLMCVLDQNNNGHDSHVLAQREDAIRQIDAWASDYKFDRDAAVALVDEVFADR